MNSSLKSIGLELESYHAYRIFGWSISILLILKQELNLVFCRLMNITAPSVKIEISITKTNPVAHNCTSI